MRSDRGVGGAGRALAAIVVIAALASTGLARGGSDLLRLRDRLLDGLAGVPNPTTNDDSAPLALFGEDALPIAEADAAGGGPPMPVIAICSLRRGVALALPSERYFSTEAMRNKDLRRFLVNAIRTLAGERTPTVALYGGARSLVPTTTSLGMVTLVPRALERSQLRQADVLCLTARSAATEDERDAVQLFMRSGGAVICAHSPDAPGLTRAEGSVEDRSWNGILAPAGIAWVETRCHPPGARTPFRPVSGRRPDLRLEHALTVVTSGEGSDLPGAALEVGLVPAALVAEHCRLRSAIEDLQEAALEMRIGPERPVVADEDPIALCRVRSLRPALVALGPYGGRAHAAAKAFPGTVDEDTPRTFRYQTLGAGGRCWESTGLYAVAGESIRLRVSRLRGPSPARLRVGCHTDRLWGWRVLRRFPEVSQSYKIDRGLNKVADSFGGLVFLERVPGVDSRAGCEISGGVVSAPFFVAGQTSSEDWRTLRGLAAPWGELVGRRAALMLPSSQLRGLDDPQAVTDFWDEAVGVMGAVLGNERDAVEMRLTVDVQIAAGSATPGYPCVLPIGKAPMLVDADGLRAKRDWAVLDCVARSLPAPELPLPGLTSPPTDLAVVAACDLVCERPVDLDAHWIGRGAKAYLDGDEHSLAAWQANRAAVTYWYATLAREVGWDVLAAVTRELVDDPPARGKRVDRLLTTLAAAAGRDLSGHFVEWGLKPSDEARAAVKDLPPARIDIPR